MSDSASYQDYLEDILQAINKALEIHAYVGVNTEVVWQTVREDLPELESLIRTMNDRLDNSRS